MEGEKFQFKTNIYCVECVSIVKSVLDNAICIKEWSVDINNLVLTRLF